MSFTRVRSPGGWNARSTLLNTEMEQFDDQLSNALDGRHGGAYAPDNPLTIGGSGVEVTTTLAIGSTGQSTWHSDGSLDAHAALVVRPNGSSPDGILLNTDGSAQFAVAQFNIATDGSVDSRGAFVIRPSGVAPDKLLLGTDGSIYAGSGAFQVGSNGHVTTGLVCDSTLVAGGTILSTLIVGPVTAGNITEQGLLQFTGSGHPRYRVAVATDADGTFSVSTADIVALTTTVLTATRVWTIDSVGASDGDEMVISRAMDSAAQTVVVRRASDLASLGTLSSSVRSIRIAYVASGGGWITTERHA